MAPGFFSSVLSFLLDWMLLQGNIQAHSSFYTQQEWLLGLTYNMQLVNAKCHTSYNVKHLIQHNACEVIYFLYSSELMQFLIS